MRPGVVYEAAGASRVATMLAQCRRFPEFRDAIYKFEVVAIESREDDPPERGNQTITESFFCTAPILTVDCELPD